MIFSGIFSTTIREDRKRFVAILGTVSTDNFRQVVQRSRRSTRRKFTSEEKIRIVLAAGQT